MSERFLITDCGSTTTKALLIGCHAGRWRLLGTATAPTTVEAPTADILVGVREATAKLERETGLRLLDDDGSVQRRRRADDEAGVDRWMSSSSAGGGLQMLVMGVVRRLTAASAARAALGAGAIVTDIMAWDDEVEYVRRIEVLRCLRPDIVLLAGGEDGGARRQVVALAELLATARLRPRYGRKMPVIFAGNCEAADDVARALGKGVELIRTENLHPSLETENPGPARRAIHEVFLRHVMARAPGYPDFLAAVDDDVIPTPAAVGRILRSVAGQCGGDVLAVDIGGATTDVFSVVDRKLQRTVSANLGMSYSMANVCREAGCEQVIRWLPQMLSEGDLRNRVRNKSIRPTDLPCDETDLLVEEAVAREALRLAVCQHREMLDEAGAVADTDSEADGSDTPSLAVFSVREESAPPLATVEMLIGSGGVLAHSPDVGRAALILLDSLQPTGLTRLFLDRYFTLPHLGVLVEENESAAGDVLWGDSLLDLGWVLAPIAHGARDGDLLCRCHLDGGAAGFKAEVIECRAGRLERLDLDIGSEATFRVVPQPDVDCGAGSGVEVTKRLTGGVLGVILDGRGRPLCLPQDDEQRAGLLKEWRSVMSVSAGGRR